MRVILGIQEAHDASAALMIDGKIVAAIQEERFTGLKGDYGFPKQAVFNCLKIAGIRSHQIDKIVLASHAWNPVLTKIKRNANFSVTDWVTEQQSYWKPKLLQGKDVDYYDLYKDRSDFMYDDFYPMDHLLKGYMDSQEMNEMATIRIKTISEFLKIPFEHIQTVTHEDCHIFYSYFGSPIRGKALALTAEGIGDYSNGTVSEISKSGRQELSSTKENHIGHIFQYMTLILGMKPIQHEYKVMGLAPYANIKEIEKSYKVFENILKVDGLNIVFDKKPRDLYFHFRDALEGHRFDGIAGAVQKFTENLLVQWIKNCIDHTSLGNVCFSGGVAQNIKACKSLLEIESLDNLYVCPAAGDTSLPIGACYYAMWQHLTENKIATDMLQPLENMYMGPEFSREEILENINRSGITSKYSMQKDISPELIAAKLAEGKIIARSVGRMEFGLRALGNRSILADPRRPETVMKINQAIKFRDFWMPFTPTILAEREYDYIINPKNIKSPFMTMAFDSTEKARKELVAALHPADFTARPQILEESANPEYYAIIKKFEKLTGVGGILNTSLNLHGDPIALGPKEAIYTFENSMLDGLIVGDYLIERN